MVKTRSNSSATASNGEKNAVSQEHLEVAKSANSGDGKKETIVATLPDPGNEGNSLNSLTESAIIFNYHPVTSLS